MQSFTNTVIISRRATRYYLPLGASQLKPLPAYIPQGAVIVDACATVNDFVALDDQGNLYYAGETYHDVESFVASTQVDPTQGHPAYFNLLMLANSGLSVIGEDGSLETVEIPTRATFYKVRHGYLAVTLDDSFIITCLEEVQVHYVAHPLEPSDVHISATQVLYSLTVFDENQDSDWSEDSFQADVTLSLPVEEQFIDLLASTDSEEEEEAPIVTVVDKLVTQFINVVTGTATKANYLVPVYTSCAEMGVAREFGFVDGDCLELGTRLLVIGDLQVSAVHLIDSGTILSVQYLPVGFSSPSHFKVVIDAATEIRQRFAVHRSGSLLRLVDPFWLVEAGQSGVFVDIVKSRHHVVLDDCCIAKIKRDEYYRCNSSSGVRIQF